MRLTSEQVAQRAQLAMSLRDNEAFQEALASIRKDALEGLVRTPATDADAIRDHQATVRVIDELRAKIDAYIRQGSPRTPPGIA